MAKNIPISYARREAEALSSLRHPNIVEMFGMQQGPSGPYMLLEYIDGCSFFTLVNTRGPLSEDVTRKLFRPLMSAIAYVHDAGFFHRDIKLENILLDFRTRSPKLIDWGFSSTHRKGEFHTVSLGSRAYSAPEMFGRKPYYEGPELDIWSLGVVLFAMLHLRLPFDQSLKDPDLFSAMMNSSLKNLKIDVELSSELRLLLSFMIDWNTNTRASAMEILESDWIQAKNTKTIDDEDAIELGLIPYVDPRLIAKNQHH